jgi:hypothetical protein
MINRGLRNGLCMASTSDGRTQAFLNRRLAGVILPAPETRELLPGELPSGGVIPLGQRGVKGFCRPAATEPSAGGWLSGLRRAGTLENWRVVGHVGRRLEQDAERVLENPGQRHAFRTRKEP